MQMACSGVGETDPSSLSERFYWNRSACLVRHIYELACFMILFHLSVLSGGELAIR